MSPNCHSLGDGHYQALDRDHDRSDWRPASAGASTAARAAAAPTASNSGGGGGVETPTPSQPFSLDTEMNWTATAELVPRQHLVGGEAGPTDKVGSLVVLFAERRQ